MRYVLQTVVTLFFILAGTARAQVTLIDFDNIPSYPTPVDSFGHMFPGLSLISSNTWLADSVNNNVFQNIHNRSISTFDGTLRIAFDLPVHSITMDLGSGNIGDTLTIGVIGLLGNQLVFSNSFVTHPVPQGGDEIRAFNIGIVDTILISKTGGGSWLTMDNLSFTVPEPSAGAIAVLGLACAFFQRRKLKPRQG